MAEPSDITRRKDDHLRICLEGEVESGGAGGLDRYRLAYRALPEIALDEVDLQTRLFGHELAMPFVVGAMTGGTLEAGRINRLLARAAQRHGVGLALGSGRALLADPSLLDSFRVRDVAPDVLLFANLGAVQLGEAGGMGPGDCARLVELCEADALYLHLNPLQEAVQAGGDTDFRGLVERIGEVAAALEVPVLVKEVGAGIGPQAARLLAGLPLAGVECAGLGGTSWARVEALRDEDPVRRSVGLAVGGVGIPTAESLLACREALPERIVIASGGLRTARDMARCLALGADAVACALPLLRAAASGAEALDEILTHYRETLRVLHFATGARRPRELRGRIEAAGP